MKKKFFLFILAAFSMIVVQAQTVPEWTQQKKTKLEYLFKQIAALQSYVQVAEKGYSIAANGLEVIQHMKRGDMALHTSYLTSLGKLNPHVKNYWKVAAIITLQWQLLARCNQERRALAQDEKSPVFQITYFNGVTRNLLQGSEILIDNLTSLLIDDALSMKDEERLQRIDKLYVDMQERCVFMDNFCAQMNSLTNQRANDGFDIRTLHELY